MKQTIYVTLDLRRGMWVPAATGAKIICSYKSDLLTWMREQGADIWCFEEEFPEAALPQSTFLLLSRALTLNMLRDLDADLDFIVFKPSNKIKRWVEEQGWTLLASEVAVCRQLEDKIEFAELAMQHEVPLPRHQLVLWNPDDLQSYRDALGDRLIVQGRMGHAGSCTYLIDENSLGTEVMDGTRVKVSEYIEGPTYTVNAYADSEGHLALGPVWQQVMHVGDWNSYDYGTVGVSSVELDDTTQASLESCLMTLLPLLKQVGYRGFFGIDVMKDTAGKWYIIECNPRLTATVSLQCLEDLMQDRPGLLQLHAEAVSLNHHRIDLDTPAHISQLILRNTKERPWMPPKTLKSGIYTQDASGEWKLRERAYDARQLEEGECLLLLSRAAGTTVAVGSDYASLQWKGSVYTDRGQIDDRIMDFYDRVVLGYLIRPKDFWTDKYTRVTKPSWLIQKPVPQGAKFKTQTEVQPDEVIRLLGEAKDHWLVEKADGTRGWLSQLSSLDQWESAEAFEMPHRKSQTAEAFLESWKGTPYKWGGNSKDGIDCSAFVQRYFWEVKGVALPKHSQDQRAACQQELTRDELQDDDLIFLHSQEKNIAHVALFFGGKVWHSSLETGVLCQSLEALEERYSIDAFRRFRLSEAS